MIGEQFLGRATAGQPLRVEVPEGARFLGVRVDSVEPYRIEFRRPADGLVLAATASEGGAMDEGDFPGSAISLATGLSGEAQPVDVVVSIDCDVYGATQ